MNTRIDMQPVKRYPDMTGFSITALVLGCVCLAFAFLPIINNITFFCGVLGVIFGLIAVIRSRRWMPVFGILAAAAGMWLTLHLQAKWSAELDEIREQFDRDTEQFEEDLDRQFESIVCDPTLPGTPPADCP